MSIKKSEQERKMEGTDHLERKLFLYIQKTVNAELAPIYQILNQYARHMTKLADRVAELEKSYRENAASLGRQLDESSSSNTISGVPPVIFQEIKVEKLFIERFDQANNLGNIGIKELSGHLNIGTTYEKVGLEDADKETKGEFEELKGMYKRKMDELNEKGNKDGS